ncbi:MAG: methyltransferase [Gammaproteobacteria bacterium]
MASEPERTLESVYISRNLPGARDNTGAIKPARVEQLLGHLQSAGIISGKQEHGYRLASGFSEFLNPASCFYKGGTLRLMEMAPPSAAQSWEALEQERAPAESRMDETIKSPDLAETYAFALHMDAQGAGADASLASSGLIRSTDRVLDLAGGAGSYSICSAIQSPEPRFYLLEQYPMTEVARSWIKQYGIETNVEVFEGNMFELSSIEKVVSEIRPNTVFASNIFHDWGPEENVALAREVYNTLPEGGRFILHEMPLSEDGFSCDIAAGFSETLRIWTEGMQYRISEMEEMLRRAGFRFIETTDSLGPFKFIVAVR